MQMRQHIVEGKWAQTVRNGVCAKPGERQHLHSCPQNRPSATGPFGVIPPYAHVGRSEVILPEPESRH